jgi:hypothetical protein
VRKLGFSIDRLGISLCCRRRRQRLTRLARAQLSEGDQLADLGNLLSSGVQMLGLTGPIRKDAPLAEFPFRPLDQLSDEAVEKFPRSFTYSSTCSRMCGIFGLR